MAQVAAQEVRAAIERNQVTALAAKFKDAGVLTAKDVTEAAQQGDELAKKIIQSTGERLGEGLAILIDLFNPERIVIGGLAMRIGEPLLAPRGGLCSGKRSRPPLRFAKSSPPHWESESAMSRPFA